MQQKERISILLYIDKDTQLQENRVAAIQLRLITEWQIYNTQELKNLWDIKKYNSAVT